VRIALVHPYPWPEVRRGAERYLEDLSWYLAKSGHEVAVVTGTHGAPCTERGENGATIHRLAHLRPGPAWRLGVGEVETFGARAVGRLVELRPEVVHAFTPSGALAGRLAGRRTLYTVLGHPDREQLPTARFARRLFTAAVRRASATAVLSKASARALNESVGRPAVVLPPGVRLERFAPALDPRSGPPRLLFSASLADHRKRADLAVATLALVLQRHPDARLALSGEGDPAWVLGQAERAGKEVKAAIDVLGPGDPEDVPERYRTASVTLLPSEHEAFGLALVESLACGTPVVCAPSGGMPEVAGGVDAGTGAVAAASSAQSLAEAVEAALSLAADRSTPKRCVRRARLWDWDEAVGPAHERLYRQLSARVPSSRLEGMTISEGNTFDRSGGWPARPRPEAAGRKT